MAHARGWPTFCGCAARRGMWLHTRASHVRIPNSLASCGLEDDRRGKISFLLCELFLRSSVAAPHGDGQNCTILAVVHRDLWRKLGPPHSRQHPFEAACAAVRHNFRYAPHLWYAGLPNAPARGFHQVASESAVEGQFVAL